MIYFTFRVRNPFVDYQYSPSVYYKDLSIPYTKHKRFSIQLEKSPGLIVDAGFNYTIREDHAGLFLDVGLFGYSVILNVYDDRHWDYENNVWKEHNESISEG